MFCAMDLYQQGVPADKLRLYTQGGPRIGDKAFAEYVLSTNVPVTRLINKLDGKFMANTNGQIHIYDEFYRWSSHFKPYFCASWSRVLD